MKIMFFYNINVKFEEYFDFFGSNQKNFGSFHAVFEQVDQ